MERIFSLSACGAMALVPLVCLLWRSLPGDFPDPTYPSIQLPVATNARSCGTVGPIVSLADGDHWMIAGVGDVPDQELRRRMSEHREQAHRGGRPAWVVLRIGADKPAIHIQRFFQTAGHCRIDGIRVVVADPAGTAHRAAMPRSNRPHRSP